MYTILMPRIARVNAVGFPHHITQRGNYRQPVFEDDDDYSVYMRWLDTYSKKFSLRIWAYCLMTNHVHFIAVPQQNDSMSKTLNTLHMRYSQFFNKRRGLTGHLWQGRFYSTVLDERHLYAGIRYVENNPVRAGIVHKAEDYRWSSTQDHLNMRTNSLLSEDCYVVDGVRDWLMYLREGEESTNNNIRKNTRTGRPCGDEPFISQIELLMGRNLAARPHGRPKGTIK
ncbi:MAG: transposase [Candidatus Magnetominusculus sp. LBB02]|nr:transposase [Candidatus Magnetominusculus sp. LBB02]